MINLQSLSKSYGGRTLLQQVSFQMNARERLGLVGRNGSGKSTLLRIILGEEEADEGKIVFPRNYQIGHLAQHLVWTELTVLDEACLGLRPDEVDCRYKVEAILLGLGFQTEDFERAPQEFSGGFQIRINLAKLLVSEPNMLLLDEPTNYLDIVSIRWMIRFLKAWRGEMILISHDRDFMDQVTTHTAAIHRQKIRKIPGPTEKLYAQIFQDEEIFEKTRVNEEKKRKQVETFVNRFRAQATKASAVQSRVKQLEKMPSLEKLAHLDELDFSFQEAPFEANLMLRAENLGYHYKPEVPLIAGVTLQLKPGDRVAIIGKNGKGKTTLLNLLAGEISPQEGTLKTHLAAKIGYFGQSNIARLHPTCTIEEEVLSSNPKLSRTQVRNICGTMMFSGDQAEKKVNVLSGGEKSRVMLGKILAQPSNILLLDEPTNHLDMESIEALIESLEAFSGAVVIVTHNEGILKALATRLIVFQQGKIQNFEGNYEEFLEKIGWEDENADKPSSSKNKKREKLEAAAETSAEGNKKDNRKQRSEIIAERSQKMTPLKKEIETLEQKIGQLENKIAQLNEELVQASMTQNSDQLATLPKKIKEKQREMHRDYDRLELMMNEQDKLEKFYNDKLESA